MRVIIVDDEEDARVMLRNILQQHFPDILLCAEASSVQEAVAAINKEEPDLVFLDVRLSPGSGFDVLGAIKSPAFEVIFVTAHDEYAIRALRMSAIDYLLKPLDIDELTTAIASAKKNQTSKSQDLRLEVLKESKLDRFGRMVLPTLDGFEVINLSQLLRCEADRNYTHLYLSDGRKFTASRNLKTYEDMLYQQDFQRIHQSHIVNLAMITAYKRRKKGGIVLLENGEELPVSEQRKAAFMERFMG